MQTRTIPNYGKTHYLKFNNKPLYKYRCRWIKTEISKAKVFAKRYYCGTMNILAENLDDAINKAITIKGCKPNLIQRI